LGQDSEFVPVDTSSYDPGGGIIDTTPPFLPDQTDIPFFSAPPVAVDQSMFDPTGGLVNTVPAVDTNTRDIANMYAGAVASGAMTAAQAAEATAKAISIAKGAAAGNKPALGPGASPRVATRPPGAASSVFTQQAIGGVPNWVLFAGGALALVAMGRR
jgi:hypothetical protein